MALSVAELVEMPELRTWIHAGAAGADRLLTWAHVCELPDPGEWLTGGELVMTTGLGVPAGAAAQRRYVEQLAEANAGALAIGHGMSAPPLTAELARTADRLALPVLLTSYEVPFIALARAVAGRADDDRQEVTQNLRIYEAARAVASGRRGQHSDLLGRLADILRREVAVVSPRTGRPLLSEPSPELAGAADALRDRLAARGAPMPAVLRFQAGGRPYLAVPVPASSPAVLVASAAGAHRRALSGLHHVATLAALELEKEIAERERRRAHGAEVLSYLLEGRLDADVGSTLLAGHGVTAPMVVVACERSDAALEHAELHHRLGERGVSAVLVSRGPTLHVLLPAGEPALTGLLAELDPAAQAGVSGDLDSLGRLADSLRESLLALRVAQSRGAREVRYHEVGSAAPLLPRSVEEARMVFEHVLGPVRDHDEARGGELLRSLRVLLAHNRSWQRAAAVLHVHKQTLVYRMKRVEQLTGRRLDRIDDVAQLWLALRAGELVEIDERGARGRGHPAAAQSRS